MSPVYWQVSAGDEGRDYTDTFLKYGLAFVGGDKQINQMLQVKLGDRIILKSGLSKISSIGEVVEKNGKSVGNGDKEWLMDFDGWILPAYCYVAWREFKREQPLIQLTRGTIKRYNNLEGQAKIEEWLNKLEVLPTEKEPESTESVEDSEILEMLIANGLRPSSAEELTNAFARIRLLAKYYYNSDWSWIKEHETRTFLIIPLFIALGWAEQQIKIELPIEGRRQHIDLACFSKPYNSDDEPVLILESKSFYQGLSFVDYQAKAYAETFSKCKIIIVSNGYCYKAYKRKQGIFSNSPDAYINILHPKRRYPVDPKKIDGCLEMLRLLLPSTWIH